MNLKNNDLPSIKNQTIKLILQTSKTGTYNLSCGPEGVFILDENENLIQSELKKLNFENPIYQKNIMENTYSEIINPIIPEPLKY